MHVDASAQLEQQTEVVGAPVSTHKGTLCSPLWHHIVFMGPSEATEHCPDMQALG